MWVVFLKWEVKCVFCANDFPHLSQLNGNSPVWVRLWLTKLIFCANLLVQRSPVWVHVCSIRWIFWANFFSHSSQANGFSPVWFAKCATKLVLFANLSSHWLHAYGFSPLWIRLRMIKFYSRIYRKKTVFRPCGFAHVYSNQIWKKIFYRMLDTWTFPGWQFCTIISDGERWRGIVALKIRGRLFFIFF